MRVPTLISWIKGGRRRRSKALYGMAGKRKWWRWIGKIYTKMINDSVIRSEIIILFSEGGFNFQNNIINYHGFECCCCMVYTKLDDYAVFHFSGNEESNLLQNKLPPGCYKYYPIPLTWLQSKPKTTAAGRGREMDTLNKKYSIARRIVQCSGEGRRRKQSSRARDR